MISKESRAAAVAAVALVLMVAVYAYLAGEPVAHIVAGLCLR